MTVQWHREWHRQTQSHGTCTLESDGNCEQMCKKEGTSYKQQPQQLNTLSTQLTKEHFLYILCKADFICLCSGTENGIDKHMAPAMYALEPDGKKMLNKTV